MISIVSPVYNASSILETLINALNTTLNSMRVDFEIILVDDRSPDDSWKVMSELSEKFENLKIARLSRNFGQHPTIMAGLSLSKGDWVVVMDCDMQDHPDEIPRLFEKAKEGFDTVRAARIKRKDSWLKKMSSTVFYKVFNYFSGAQMNGEIANFGIYNRKVVDAVLSMKDDVKFFPLFVQWVGFKTIDLPVEHHNRLEGESSYNWKRLFSMAFHIILSFSNKPLRLFINFGALISLISFLVSLLYLVLYFMGKISEPGFTSIILSIWFLAGLIISGIGILGVYLGKTFDQTKNRPVFIIDELHGN